MTSKSTSKYSILDGNEDSFVESVAIPSSVQAKPVIANVELVAPADLVAGYEFTVDFEGKDTLIRVPEGGVKKGQIFTATVLKQVDDEAGEDDNIPQGHWRDGTCDCCAYGCCHPLCCLACWCRAIALGQVMTRMKLDAWGREIKSGSNNSNPYWNAFKILLIATLAVIVFDQSIGILVNPYYFQFEENDDGAIVQKQPPAWVLAVMGFRQFIQLSFGLYVLVLMISTRAFIRNRYAIPEQHCKGCEDCCCSFWCSCCAVSQMARHTADYTKHSAACCTDTGLADQPSNVV